MKLTQLLPYVALLLVILIALAVLSRRLERSKAGTGEYRSRRVLSDPEAILFFRLQQALPEHVVLSQVAMHRLLAVKTGGKPAFNRIAQKAVDYVICHKDFSVLCVVELDDASHHASRDASRDALLATAGIATVRFEVKALPSAAEIRKAIEGLTTTTRASASRQIERT